MKRIPPDRFKAESLLHASREAVATAKGIPQNEESAKSIVRELYEGLRQFCEAIGYLRGYKFASHEAIAGFIGDLLQEPDIAARFDRYRKLRNGINYYGDDVAPETVKEALLEIPAMIDTLRKHLKV